MTCGVSTSLEANLGDTTTGGRRFLPVPGSVPTRSPQNPRIESQNLLLMVSLRGKAAVFQKSPPTFASAKEIRPIRKCLCRVYLEARGEVAERLKAAVC